MARIDNFLERIPSWMSSRVSIFIYIFLFVYLVLFGLLGLLFPALETVVPSSESQAILGNYSNVLSALGASIAAGSGVAIHKHLKAQHDDRIKKHEELKKTLAELHKKIDNLSTDTPDK